MPKNQHTHVSGAGLGLRRGFLDTLLQAKPCEIDFVEVAPENWISMGGNFREKFEAVASIYPVSAHGLSLSIGGPTPIDTQFVNDVKTFLDTYNIGFYSEHLSFCSDDGHLYDLMPIPFTEEAVHYVAKRIRQVQDILQRRIAVENVSFYAMQTTELSEIDYVNAVLTEADCDLLLDVNNIYVNAVNHKAYTPEQFIAAMPKDRVAMMHIAGHDRKSEDLIIDTHGAPVITTVWDILEHAYTKFGPVPTLLERDFNFPPLDEMVDEVRHIKKLQHRHEATNAKTA